jgi:subtilisin family serine protease
VGDFDSGVQAAVAYAEARNVVLVAGAGNDGVEADNYPAAYPGVVSVAAADQDGQIWDKSDYGPSVVLTAPGVHIVAAGAGSDTEYRLSDGTSDATAYVSAAAALLRAKYPSLTAGQIINRLVQTAAKPGAPSGQGVRDPHYGFGIIRPDLALTQDIPAGPAAGPLPQLASASSAAVEPSAIAASAPSSPGAAVQGSSAGRASARSAPASSAPLMLGLGAAAVAVIGLVLTVLFRRRRSRLSDQ